MSCQQMQTQFNYRRKFKFLIPPWNEKANRPIWSVDCPTRSSFPMLNVTVENLIYRTRSQTSSFPSLQDVPTNYFTAKHWEDLEFIEDERVKEVGKQNGIHKILLWSFWTLCSSRFHVLSSWLKPFVLQPVLPSVLLFGGVLRAALMVNFIV
jgi:hypothetical protein